MSTLVTARDVPEIRARMAAWARDLGTDGAVNWFRFFLGPSPAGATESRVFDRIDDVGATIAGTLAAQFPAAELFYVSTDMTDLARHSWGPGRGGLWVRTWAATSASRQRGILRIGRTLAQAPHDEVLTRARTAAARGLPEPTPKNKPSTEAETAGQAADHILAMWLPNLERAPIPPSFAPPHGYDWCALTPMEFTEMEGWPGGVSEGESPADADATIALQRTILATWLLMGQTLVRSVQLTAPRAARRRIARDDPHLDPTVRYIDLRRARTEPSDHTADEPRTAAREYRHRWIVRGLNRTSLSVIRSS